MKLRLKDILQEEYESTVITIPNLAKKHKIKYNTVFVWAKRYQWKKKDVLNEVEEEIIQQEMIEELKQSQEVIKEQIRLESANKEEKTVIPADDETFIKEEVIEKPIVIVDRKAYEESKPVNESGLFNDKKLIREILDTIVHLLVRGYETEIDKALKSKYPEYAEDFNLFVIHKLKQIARRRLTRLMNMDGKYVLVEYMERLNFLYRTAIKIEDFNLAFNVTKELARTLNIQKKDTITGFDIEKFTNEQMKKFELANQEYENITIKDIEN